MKTIVNNVTVNIDDVKVDKRYFSFKYKIFVDGKLKKDSEYESDHVWSDDIKGFRSLLKSSLALKIVLNDLYGR